MATAPAQPPKNGGKLTKKPRGSGKKVRVFFGAIRDAVRGMGSDDLPTRRKARLFVASLLGLFGVLFYYALHSRQVVEIRRRFQAEHDEESQRISEFLKKQAEDAKQRYTHQAIGTFTLEIAVPAGAPRTGSVTNLAELDLVVQCDLRRTCIYVEEHETEVRNQVVSALGTWERDELLSVEGKKRLKGQVAERINQWLSQGKITDVFISRLVVN